MSLKNKGHILLSITAIVPKNLNTKKNKLKHGYVQTESRNKACKLHSNYPNASLINTKIGRMKLNSFKINMNTFTLKSMILSKQTVFQ